MLVITVILHKQSMKAFVNTEISKSENRTLKEAGLTSG